MKKTASVEDLSLFEDAGWFLVEEEHMPATWAHKDYSAAIRLGQEILGEDPEQWYVQDFVAFKNLPAQSAEDALRMVDSM